MLIRQASTPDELDAARALVGDYFLSWGMDDVDDPDLLEELATLDDTYVGPGSALLVAFVDDEPAGVVAFRRHDERSCVMKRMFVRQAFRRRGVGRCLAIRLLKAAARMGYRRMVLDTPADNERALGLYRSLGFTPTEPYMDPNHDHVHEGWSYWEIALPPDDEMWFRWTKELLETAYLSTDNIYMQSGNTAGTAERWNATRIIVADCIERDGTFLDIGCANGLLMESVARWGTDRGLKVEPYGVDISEKLAALARARLPLWADRIFVGNAWMWDPPRRFDVVATRAGDYTPEHLRRAFVERLLDRYVATGGRLVMHWSGLRQHGDVDWDAIVRSWGLPVSGTRERLDDAGEPVSRALWIDR